jgi:hypothetical protein
MKLTRFDWSVVAGYFAVNLLIGLWYRKRATGSTEDYFVSGRNASWWLAGTSMVATTFAADTPLAVTGLVSAYGIAGNWLWWNLLLSNMLTVFFFARLWRRAGVVTDLELTELRYGGKSAAFLRGFRALYLGLPINCIILGWVNLAMVKILLVIFPDLHLPALGIHDPKIAALGVVFVIMLLTATISTLSEKMRSIPCWRPYGSALPISPCVPGPGFSPPWLRWCSIPPWPTNPRGITAHNARYPLRPPCISLACSIPGVADDPASRLGTNAPARVQTDPGIVRPPPSRTAPHQWLPHFSRP